MAPRRARAAAPADDRVAGDDVHAADDVGADEVVLADDDARADQAPSPAVTPARRAPLEALNAGTAPPERRVFCNRTLNLRGIRAIGYDMDYTLVHYRSQAWEGAAFDHAKRLLAAQGWPVDGLSFDLSGVTLGLAFDLELGNLVKATRFGYVIRAAHGTRQLSFDELRSTYSGIIVDLAEPRFRFMNTLFSLSEASLYGQLVNLLDGDELPGTLGYGDLYAKLKEVLEETHTQGELKARIVSRPEAFIEPDEDLVATLADQRHAGKTLMLITNSDWAYTKAMMSYTVDRLLGGGSWRDLFDLVIVEAAKPAFFSGRRAVYRLVDPQRGLFEPHRGPLVRGEVYVGGDATLVEASLGLGGAEILYLGDHLFGDVHVSKAMLRWRTGLVLRELEAEVRAQAAFAPVEAELESLMATKTALDRQLARHRLARLRLRKSYAPPPPDTPSNQAALEAATRRLTREAVALDASIARLARAAGEIGNVTWGPLMRAGNDKSLFARQVERHADVYTSRVSNLLVETPYAYLRAARGSLPHDDA